MSWNKKQLRKSNLYLILDAQARLPDGKVLSKFELLQQLKTAVRCGVDIVQLRDKNSSARDILEFSKQIKGITSGKALFIMNDRVDLAILAGADGVHVGQDDIPYNQVRDLIGKEAIIGVSCQTKEQAQRAQRAKVDYLGFGSVFKTQTKPDRQPMKLELLKSIVKTIQIPTFAIGGITLGNVQDITKIGVRRVAVCRDILFANDPARVVKDFKVCLSSAGVIQW